MQSRNNGRDNQVISIIQHCYRKLSARMGNQESWNIFEDVRNWKQLTRKRMEITGTPSLMKDQISSLLADCYDIPLHHNYNYQHKMITRHKNIDDPSILRLIDARIKEKTLLQCGSMDVIQIFTEACCCRFNQICLNDSQHLMVIHQVLRGCQILLPLVENYFMISAKMIGFTENGRIKVWFNQNFGKYDLDQNNLLRTQQEMVRSIFSLFTNKFSRSYDFFKAASLSQAIYQIQMNLKMLNVTQIVSELQIKLRKTKILQTSSSFKKLSMSDKSINEAKTKPIVNHRPSIEYSLQKLNNMRRSNMMKIKQNHDNLSFLDLSHKVNVNQPILKLKKRVENDAKAQVKISLTDPLYNPSHSYLNSTFEPRMSVPCPKKPKISINYESHQVRPFFQNISNQVQNLTLFPQQNVLTPSIIMKKTSLLRSGFRKFSEIPERSQEGENTSSQMSEFDETGDLDNSQNILQHYENWKKTEEDSQIFYSKT